MKKLVLWLGIVSLLNFGVAMETKTQKGAAIGTGVGAAVGRDLPGDRPQYFRTLIGAAAGAVAGGLTGGAIGSYMDKQEATMRQELAMSGASVQETWTCCCKFPKSGRLFPYDSIAKRVPMMNGRWAI